MLLFSTLLDIKKKMTRDTFIRLVIAWNQSSPHVNNIIPDIKWNGEKNIRYGTEELWLDIQEYRNQNIIAVRYEKKEDDGIVWDTDYVMNFDSMKMAVRLDRSYTEDALETDPKFSTPHFIKLLIDKGHIEDDGDLSVLCSPVIIGETNLELLTNIINGHKHYKLPIVYVSKTYCNDDPVNVSTLAYKLKGAAHVLVEESNTLNQRIRDNCNSKNEYYGAIGIYYPRKAWEHKKYLYRNSVGYDNLLMDKVLRAVIHYSNSQQTDTLLTWQGVNNALLRDRLASQRQERLAAEEARRKAEALTTMLIDTRDEEERRIRKQALDDARNEANSLLDSFDGENTKLQQKVEELVRANETLQFENQGLKAKLDSRDTAPVLYLGEEIEFYPGEIKDILLAVLSEALKEIPSETRREHIVKDIIHNNDYQKLSESKAEKLKQVLKNYNGMSKKTRQALDDLGFKIAEEGKHYKITYYGDERYQTTYAKTPSDNRSGKNNAQQTIKMAF